MSMILYRKRKEEKGVRHYYVRVEKRWIEVEKEIYMVYEADAKRELRRWKEESDFEFLSYEKIIDDYEADDSLSGYIPTALQSRSAEEYCFDYSDFSDDAEFLAWFKEEVRKMPVDRQAFLNLFKDCGCSFRSVAEKTKMPKTSVTRFFQELFAEMVEKYYNEVIG